MYAQEESAFVASRVFPIVPVAKQSDRYATYSRADFNRNLMAKRAPSTESAGGGYRIDTTATYSCDVWALHRDIDDQIRSNADSIFNLDVEATRWLVNQALISREVDWASSFFTTGVWATDWTGVSAGPTAGQFLQWDNSTSTPITDIRRLKQAVQLKSGGFRPNTMVMGRPVFDIICDHASFIDRVKYGQTPDGPAKVNMSAMAALFEVDRVLVMDSILNTAGEQAGPNSGGTDINAGELNKFIGGASGVDGKGVLLTYTPVAPGLMTPASGYTFAWTGFFGAAANGTRIKSFYIDTIASTRVEMDAAYDQKVVGKEMGAYLTSVIS